MCTKLANINHCALIKPRRRQLVLVLYYLSFSGSTGEQADGRRSIAPLGEIFQHLPLIPNSSFMTTIPTFVYLIAS